MPAHCLPSLPQSFILSAPFSLPCFPPSSQHPHLPLPSSLPHVVGQVIFVYNAIDDFVMNNLKTYHGRDFKTAEATGLDLGPDKKTEEEEGEKQGGGESYKRGHCEKG